MLKLVPVSLFGLAFNAICNSVFILQIAKSSDSELLAQSMVMWSGFFVAGACVAPFENYFLYRRIGETHDERDTGVVILSSVLFLTVGTTLIITQKASFWIAPLTLLLGICVGKMNHLRSKAISENKLVRVSLSNSVEGFVRASTIFILIQNYEILNLFLVASAYLLGNLVSLLPFVSNPSKKESTSLQSFPKSKFYSLSAIGLVSALITGGLPYIAGFFQASSIAPLLFFFTLSRSLLILQSLLVYVNPRFAKNLGTERSLSKLVKFFIPLALIIFLILSTIKKLAEVFLAINLNSIDSPGILVFSAALLLSAFFSLNIATQNSGSRWINSLYAGLVGLIASCVAFKTIDSSQKSFYISMILAPLFGLICLSYLDRRSERAE